MPKESEKSFENKVKRFLKDEGCWFFKVWGGGYQKSGIPDLIVCCNGFFLAVELKSEIGRATELQKYQIEDIKKADGIAMILKPSGFERFKTIIRSLKECESKSFKSRML